jgi:diacylglycerol kinase family enzyme
VQPSAHLAVQTDLTELLVEHDRPFPYQLDGDYLGETQALRFEHVPEAVRLVRPATAPAR